MKLRHKLGKLQLEAESRSFPDGLAMRDALLDRAKQEATDYLAATYGVN
jgi:hypothetical protein